MSIRVVENRSNILEVRAWGRLTHLDYFDLLPRTKRMVREHGKIRVLFELGSFQGWSLDAIWDDVKFDLGHLGEVERVALVGDDSWESSRGSFCRPFTGARIRYFDRAHRLEARRWLESVPRSRSA